MGKDRVLVPHPPRHKEGTGPCPSAQMGRVQSKRRTKAPKPEPQRQSKCNPEWSHPGPERKVLLGNPRGHKLRVMLLVAKFREASGPGDKPHQCGWTSLELNRMPTCLSPVEGALSPQEDGLAFFSQLSPQEEGEEC